MAENPSMLRLTPAWPGLRRAVQLGLAVLILGVCGCSSSRARDGGWPPPDFDLRISYVHAQGQERQVRRTVRVMADGMVVYREADSSLLAGTEPQRFPIFRRLCAYKLPWESVRFLARELHAEPVLDLKQPPAAPALDGVDHEIHFDLTYFSNHVHVVARNEAAGLMNKILRTVNAYLPEGRGMLFPEMAGLPQESRVQDVPPVVDSVPGSLKFHETWLAEHAADSEILAGAFALACAGRDWKLAEACVAKLRAVDADAGAQMEKALRGLR